MCSRTVHEHLPNEILCSCLFIKEMSVFANGSQTQTNTNNLAKAAKDKDRWPRD
ncbi:hypothetical protein HanIR_Chr02g0083091 [Helianthus annuus]|nr:hypothetical protein HanIR_Chr02g0083091 [Helianthus annuus]